MTITGNPPPAEREITMSELYVRSDGAQLAALAALLGEGRLTVAIAASYPLTEAATALAKAIEGAGGAAVVLAG